jgi:hypothetical protein
MASWPDRFEEVILPPSILGVYLPLQGGTHLIGTRR